MALEKNKAQTEKLLGKLEGAGGDHAGEINMEQTRV